MKSWNGLALGWRRGSGISWIVASVLGSITTSVGRIRPTQTVTIRPCESKVTEPQSAVFSVEVCRMPLPERPQPARGVGLVGVLVEVRAVVGRHERMARGGGGAQRPRVGGCAAEIRRRAARAVGDRTRGRGRGSRAVQQNQSHERPAHRAIVTLFAES